MKIEKILTGKSWTNQLVEGNKLFGWLLKIGNNGTKNKTLIEFTKDDLLNEKYGIFEDNTIPTLILQ